MHYNLMFPSKYLRCCDLKGRDAKVVIEKVSVEELIMEGGKKSNKPVVRFVNKEKGVVLNKTNGKIIAARYGTETDQWLGKEIILYPTTTKFGKETVECIRIRESNEPQS